MVNLLKNEKSPYLKQHENNPVNWMPWNKETLKLAKVKKPIISFKGIPESEESKNFIFDIEDKIFSICKTNHKIM